MDLRTNPGGSSDAMAQDQHSASSPPVTLEALIARGPDGNPNVRISDFVAPARAYPDDRYTVTGYVQAQGLAGKSVEVELLSRAGGKSADDQAEPSGGAPA